MNTALLVMDVQNSQVERLGTPAMLAALARAVAAAREAGIPVVFVRLGFRDGHPEISARNKVFAGIAVNGRHLASDPITAIHESVAPQPAEPVVTKYRVSAFTGSDLDVLLRGLDVDTLVLTGIATSGVVLSTYTEAADRDYRLVVLSDGCVDLDPDLHRALVERFFPRMGDVLATDEWTASFRRPSV
jgi:nicotinamidase-related amidase